MHVAMRRSSSGLGHRHFVACAAFVVFTLTQPVSADSVLFEDAFENDLSAWVGKGYGPHQGLIVADPLRASNHVLTFSGVNNGGDMFSAPAISLEMGQTYEFSFEYLGLPVLGSVPDDFGGFAGISDVVADPFTDKAWMFGTAQGYPFLRDHLIDDGQWRRYSYSFVWNRLEIDALDDAVHVFLEDWSTSGPSVRDVFFDNVRVQSLSTPVVPLPPAPYAGAAIMAVMLVHRHRKTRCR